MRDKPLPPEILADALHDRIHPTSGRLLSARPVLHTPAMVTIRRLRAEIAWRGWVSCVCHVALHTLLQRALDDARAARYASCQMCIDEMRVRRYDR